MKYSKTLLFYQGMFVGMVEVGKMKFKGALCPNAEDAKQSAAAVANSNLSVSCIKLFTMKLSDTL